MLGPVGKCSKCKRDFTRKPGSVTVLCLRCGLYGVTLKKAFQAIVSTPDMLEFANYITEWFGHDENQERQQS